MGLSVYAIVIDGLDAGQALVESVVVVTMVVVESVQILQSGKPVIRSLPKGAVILRETPKIYGAEHLLTRRAVDPHVGQKMIDRIRWWEWYVDVFGATINDNPTVGNKEGGLTTIYEESLCAIAKGGSTSLVNVYEYAEPVIAKGFVVMGTPGYDPVSVTGMVGGGANVVVFTTGRGSVFGCKPVPSIKIASNSTVYRHIEDDMDVDAGVILTEATLVEAVGRQIHEMISSAASVQPAKSEQSNMGEEEFSPWLVGPML